MSTLEPSLQEIVLSRWPELAVRLGGRRAEFVCAAQQRARQFGLEDESAAARYLNLCLAFGPGFEARPEHEWALATLSDPRLSAAARIHQLVYRAETALQRQGGAADRVRAIDEALLNRMEDLRRRDGEEPPMVPRRACDLEGLQVTVVAAGERTEYARIDGGWQRRTRPAPAPSLTGDATHPLPPAIHLLAEAEPDRVTQLQVRQRTHSTCGDHHPGLNWIDDRGIQRWAGHAALGVTWPVRPAPTPLAGGIGLLEPGAPGYGVLEATNCGIRDQGTPLGTQRTRVGVYPAHQCMFALQRPGGTAFSFPREPDAAPVAAPAGKYRLERDGKPLHAGRQSAGFDVELPQALGQGLARLFEAWRANVANPRLKCRESLLSGRAALAWGWRESPQGLAAEPLFAGDVDLELLLEAEIELRGDVSHAGTQAHVRLSASGRTPLRFSACSAGPVHALAQSLQGARVRERWPLAVASDPVPGEACALWSELGPCSGAVVAEAGLRPRLAGGSAWEFFVQIELEPVLLPLAVHDPVLGTTRRTLALLPAVRLLDWSGG